MKELVLKKDPSTGVFYVRPYLGKNAITGKPLRPYKCFPEAADEEEAKRAAEAWAAGLAKAAQLNVRRRLDELMPRYVQWLEDHDAPTNTVRTYRSAAKTAAKYLKDADPDEIDAFEIDLMYTALRWKQGSLRGENLAANSVRKLHGFLSGFWCWMLSEGICTMNPMPMVPKPGYEKPVPFILYESEVVVLLTSLRALMSDDSTEPKNVLMRNLATATYLAFFSGIREGEACGLNRGDFMPWQLALVVSATAVIKDGKVVRQPKTKGKITRRVPLADEPTAMIENHIAWQDTFLPDGALRLGRKVPLFCDAKGRRLKPADLSSWFKALCETLGLPPEAHFHTLRHTYASEALNEGSDIRTVAAILGHAREGFTLETYVHVMPGRDHEAAAAVARKYGGGRDP